MTNDDELTHDDFRRAYALLNHRRVRDDDGAALVLEQTGERGSELGLALARALDAAINDVYTPTGQAAISELVAGMAQDHPKPDMRRAAQLWRGVTLGDVALFDRPQAEAMAEGPTHASAMLVALADLGVNLLPILHAESIQAKVTRWIAKLAGEDGDSP
jgi:hypothetical protein